jgi:hypothetical protein
MPPIRPRTEADEHEAHSREGWHLDKRVPVSIIVVMLLQIVTVTWYFGKLDSRVTLIETTRIDFRSQQHDRDDRQDKDNAEKFTQLSEQLQHIDSKLDRIIESPRR